LSLKAGTLADPNSQAEEVRAWIHIFKETAKAIPCEECRTHYKEWLLANPIGGFKEMSYALKGDWVRNWWWRLHGDVDRRLGKPSIEFSELSSVYATVFVRFEISTIDKFIKQATIASQVRIMDFKEWKKAIIMLNSLYY
jgi:hypothetical protein